MHIKKITAGTAMVGALGFGALGFASGVAQAKPHYPVPPPIPVVPEVWLPGDPPGHNPYGPPGQVKNGNPVVPGLTGVPPGHWGDPAYVGLPAVWRPGNWLDLNISVPQPVVFNADLGVWGIWWNAGFIPYA